MTEEQNLPPLPKGWVWIKIRQIGEVVTGKTPKKSNPDYYGGNYPFFKPGDLNSGFYVKSSVDRLSEEGIGQSRVLPEKSTLVTCIGATIGKTGFNRVQGASNQQINAIIPHKNILPEFVYFYCISPQFQKEIINNYSSTTLPILNKSKFQNLPIALSSFPEQGRIVDKLEELFTKLDAGVKSLQNIKAQLQLYRQAVLKHAFNGKLTEEWRLTHKDIIEPALTLLEQIRKQRQERGDIKYRELPKVDSSVLPNLPKSWIWTSLGYLAEKINPGFPSGKWKRDFEQGIPHLRPMNINIKGDIVLSNLKYVRRKDYDALLKDDILFNNTNSPKLLGKTTYIKKDTNWAYSNHMTRIMV